MSRGATSRLKVNPPLGTLPVLQYCTPDQLRVDATYQRSLETGPSQSLIRKIAMFWNWDLCQPLVVARRADGQLYVVDGQHRLAAAALRRDIAQLPCVISAYGSAADEAASFVALNQLRRPLCALDLFKAALAADDEEAVAIRSALTEAGLRLAAHGNYVGWKPDQIANIGGIQRCFRRSGAAVLVVALKAMARTWPGQVLRYGGTVFPGFAAVAADESRLRSVPAETVLALAALAATKSQAEWRRAAQAHVVDYGGGRSEAVEAVFRQAWRHRVAGRPAPVAQAPKLPTAPRCARSFDEQLAAVSGGASIRTDIPFSKRASITTLGGVTGEIL